MSSIIPDNANTLVQGPGGTKWEVTEWVPGNTLPFDGCKAVGIDTETEALINGAPITPALLQIAGDATNNIIFVQPCYWKEALEQLQQYSSLQWVFFNAPFDCKVMGWPEGPFLPLLDSGRLIDMEIRSVLYYMEEGTYTGKMNLDLLAQQALSWKLQKDDGVRLSFKPDTMLTDAQISYAAQDAIATIEAWKRMPDAMPTEELNLKGYLALTAISDRGMLVDEAERDRLSKQFMEEQQRLYGALQLFGVAPGGLATDSSGNAVKNPGIVKRKQQLLESLESQYKVRLPRTDSGNISTEKKSLDLSLIINKVPLPVWLQIGRDFDHARKMQRTYLNPANIGVDGRVHPRFAPMVSTGRTSCSKPNIQNMPRDGGLRGIFVPSDGYLFLSTDFNQLEVCTLAQSCWTRFGKSKLRELVNDGVDVHYWFGDSIGVKRGIHFDPKDKNDDARNSYRQRAKAAIFGFPGGLGPVTFVAYARNYKVDLTLEDAIELREMWMDALPEMRLHLKPEIDEYWTARNIKIWLNSHGYSNTNIKTMSELEHFLMEHKHTQEEAFAVTSSLSAYQCRLVSGRLKRNCTFCAAANMAFQGLAADGAKIGLWAGYCEGWRVVDFIHDEIIQEVPETWTPLQHAAFAEITENTLCDCMRVVTPDVTIRAESALMPRWYKEAKKWLDEDGGLMVWTPEEARRRKLEKEAAAAATKSAA